MIFFNYDILIMIVNIIKKLSCVLKLYAYVCARMCKQNKTLLR